MKNVVCPQRNKKRKLDSALAEQTCCPELNYSALVFCAGQKTLDQLALKRNHLNKQHITHVKRTTSECPFINTVVLVLMTSCQTKPLKGQMPFLLTKKARFNQNLSTNYSICPHYMSFEIETKDEYIVCLDVDVFFNCLCAYMSRFCRFYGICFIIL